MSEHFCSLIILGPSAPRVFKLHLSRGAITILVVAFLLSFLAIVWMGYTFPPTVNDLHAVQLEAENRNLKMETSHATIGIQRLDAKVTELEGITNRISELVEQ